MKNKACKVGIPHDFAGAVKDIKLAPVIDGVCKVMVENVKMRMKDPKEGRQ